MKAKLKPHKLLSMLLALVMVVGLLPMGQVAYAYSEGNIEGTTGSGASEADPVVCDTFAEFKAAMENEDIRFVKLTGTIETIPAQEDLSAAIDQSSPKTLIVEGTNTFIGSMNGRINCLLYVHSELNVKGSGTLEYRHGMSAGAGAVIYGLSKCSLTIQDVTLVGSINGQTFGMALYLAGDSKTKILSGTFSGYSESTVDVYNTTSAVSVNELAELTIEDGSFSATAGADSIKTYGLDINKATTKVTLNGGTYDGIDASDANLNLSDMLGTDRYYTDSNGTSVFDGTSVTSTTEKLTVRTKRIDAVDVNITVPVVGAQPQPASSTPENTKVLSTVWSSDGAVIPETGTFEAGKTYKVQVSVYTKNDYFFGDPLTVTINGSTAVTDFERPGVGNRTITFEKEYTPGNSILNSVDVSITEPVAGAEPQDAVSNTANVSVSTTEWYHNGTKLSASDTFAAGETYKVHVIVYPDSGYAFADNPTATFNGSKTGTLYTNGKGYINYYAEFTAANAPIDSVDVKITEPVAGAQPQDAVSNTANVSVGTTEWYHNGTKLSASDTFAAGETHKVHVIVYPDSGYAFADNPTATFNGSKTGTLYTNGKDYINYYAEFTIPAASTEYTIAVTNGKATVGAGTEISKAAEGTEVTLTANKASDGEIFDKWVVEDGSASITLADANSATTTFTMPAGAVSVKATYTTYITVNLAAGEGSGTMEPLILKGTYGYYELIAPDCTFTQPANKVFDKWQFSKDDSYLKPGDTKTIWSSADGSTLTAIWKDAPETHTHVWGEPTYKWADDGKSCTAERVCTKDDTHKETATATITSAVKTPATETEKGWTTYTATFTESWAAEQTKDVQDIPVLTHTCTWGEPTYKWADDGKSCTAERVCTKDDTHKETATATITSAVKTPATETEKGWTTYTATFTEDWATTQTKDVQDIPVLTHTCTWSEPTYKWAEDGKSCTAERVCTKDDTHKETATATITSAVKTPATETEKGWTTYTATFTESWAAEQTKDVQDIPVLIPIPTTYTVTFDSKGGSAVAAQTIEEGQKATKPADPTKDGYTFKGWTLNGSAYDFSTPVTDNITLVATWQKNSTSGSGGGGGGVSTYAITVDSAKNGDVTTSHKTASKGTTVTLTVEPDKGYTLETITVTDKNGDEIELTNKGDGKYTFKMPASKVYVEVTFMEDNSMLNFFVDVPADAYYYDAVLWAAKNGITGGVDDTHFAPNATCTRAQAVTFLWRAAGSPAPKSSEMPFEDVAAGSYYYDAVLWAVENGITDGTSATTFSPDAVCSRGQIVTFLWRSQKSPASDSANPFADVAADAYYNSAVLWAVTNGITDGTSATTFSPAANCTRAQIVTFLFRCLGK